MPNYNEPQDPSTEASCTLCGSERPIEDMIWDLPAAACWCGLCKSEGQYLAVADARRELLLDICGFAAPSIQIGR